jgi:AAA family ATP:ADP antiporter
VASRLLRFGGFGLVLLLLPVVSLCSYSAMALVPVLLVIKAMKIAENSVDYSIANTARQVLWLPTDRDMKYRAKAAIDTIFVRTGDAMAAVTAFVGAHLLMLPPAAFFVFNVILAIVWIAVGVVVVRENRRWVKRAAQPH